MVVYRGPDSKTAQPLQDFLAFLELAIGRAQSTVQCVERINRPGANQTFEFWFDNPNVGGLSVSQSA
jgi:hypothetical protein